MLDVKYLFIIKLKKNDFGEDIMMTNVSLSPRQVILDSLAEMEHPAFLVVKEREVILVIKDPQEPACGQYF